MSELLQYRFPAGPDGVADAGLAGHPIGNLLLAAMIALEDGDVEEGVRRLNRILAVRGQVVPASGTPLTLHARRRDGVVIDGQSQIMATPGIERVWVTPDRRAWRPGRADRHRRGRPGHPRAGLAVHEPAAEPARARHP